LDPRFHLHIVRADHGGGAINKGRYVAVLAMLVLWISLLFFVAAMLAALSLAYRDGRLGL